MMAVAVTVQEVRVDQTAVFLSPVDIGAPGHQIPLNWAPVPGATKAEVTRATLTLYPSVVEESSAGAPIQKNGNGWIVTVPAKKRVRALALYGFKQPGGGELKSSLPAGARIAVAFPKLQGSGFESPRFSVPAVAAKGEVPATLTGASFSNRTLSLNPAVAASKVRFALVTGENPLEFAEQATELGSVNLTTHTTAQNAKVVIDGGEPQWQTPEFDPAAPSVEVDLRAGLETALNKKLKAQQTPQSAITISADAPANMIFRFSGASGSLVRAETGVVKVALEGDPVALPLAAALASETPSSVTGDLTLHYSGIRILETVSDPLPSPSAALSGMIVGAEPAVCAFPPEALNGIEPARIGVFGRAPEDCEISLEFVEMVGDTVGNPLAAPAVLQLKRDNAMATRWAPVPKGTRIGRPAGLRVRANKGRFFWVASAEAKPLVRLAIQDPDPGGRPVNIGGVKLAGLRDTESHQPAFNFPVSAFRGPAPLLDSDLFLTIDFSDLTMRYAR
jgi:hypothetical protein